MNLVKKSILSCSPRANESAPSQFEFLNDETKLSVKQSLREKNKNIIKPGNETPNTCGRLEAAYSGVKPTEGL